MAHFRNVTFLAAIPVALAASSLSGLLLSSGCEAYHNEDERLAYKNALDAQEARLYPETPKAFGYDPPDPTQCPNNNQCEEDPGSRIISAKKCKEDEWGLEFLPLPIFDFEDTRDGFNDPNKNRVKDPGEDWNTGEYTALLGYVYRDKTTFNLYPVGWEPLAIDDPFDRCENPKNHAFHIAGGQFLEWGGAMGRSLRCMNTANNWGNNPTQLAIRAWQTKTATDPTDIYCHKSTSPDSPSYDISAGCDSFDDANKDPLMQSICPKRDLAYREWLANKDSNQKPFPPEELALIGTTIDVSQWEGVSFWARRGPMGQPGMRILLGDKATDDDISFGQYLIDPSTPRHCERSFECNCMSSSRPCTKLTYEEATAVNRAVNGTHRDIAETNNDACLKQPTKELQDACWNRKNAYHLNPPSEGDSMCFNRNDPTAAVQAAILLDYCGESVPLKQTDSAKSLNVQVDPLIYDTKCQPYSFRGSITNDFAYNPDSPIPAQQRPPEQSEVCGDHWMRSVTLGLDWKFYTIPFTEFLQQGWAKRSYKLDLTALSLVRFAWDRGYLDLYVDDVRFYRKKKTAN